MPLPALSQRGLFYSAGSAPNGIPIRGWGPYVEGALPFSGGRSARNGIALTGDRDA